MPSSPYPFARFHSAALLCLGVLLRKYATVLARAAALAIAAAGCSTSGEDDGAADAGNAGVAFDNLRVEDVGAYRAVIRFDTSAPTRCEAEFGTVEDALDRTATDPNMEPDTYQTEHQVPLEDLAPNTAYYVAARAEDEAGDVFVSPIAMFTTGAGAAVDDMINIAALTAGTTVTAVSSNFGGAANDATWGANHAFDGQMSTEWSSNGDGDDAFVEVDLGATKSFSVVGFRSRMMVDGTSIIERFQLVVDGITTLGPFDAADPDIRYVFELDQAVFARTVRLEALDTSGGNTGIKELQLFSAP